MSARIRATSSSEAWPDRNFERRSLSMACRREFPGHAILQRAAKPAEQHVDGADLHAGFPRDVAREFSLGVLEAEHLAAALGDRLQAVAKDLLAKLRIPGHRVGGFGLGGRVIEPREDGRV